MSVPASLPSRRTVLKSAAVVGAVSVWTVPVVESFAMSPASAEALSGNPAPPSSSIDPTSITAPPDPTTPPAGTATPTATRSGAVAPAAAGGAVPQAAGRTELANTGINLPVGTTTAVAVGTIAAGVAAVVVGNKLGGTPAVAAATDAVEAPRGPRRH